MVKNAVTNLLPIGGATVAQECTATICSPTMVRLFLFFSEPSF